MPKLHIPLRVGVVYLHPTLFRSPGLDATHRAELLERIRSPLSERKYVSHIIELPDDILNGNDGFDGLEGVQQHYGIDLVVLVSYDQFSHADDHNWSVRYHTIGGVYTLKGHGDEVVALVDLAVLDAASRSLVLRAGGLDVRRGNSTSRELATAAFSAATDQMIGHFDAALGRFEADMQVGRAVTAGVESSRSRSSN